MYLVWTIAWTFVIYVNCWAAVGMRTWAKYHTRAIWKCFHYIPTLCFAWVAASAEFFKKISRGLFWIIDIHSPSYCTFPRHTKAA